MPKPTHVIQYDLVDVWKKPKPNKRKVSDFKTKLAFGDEITVKGVPGKTTEITFTYFKETADGSVQPFTTSGFIVLAKKVKPPSVMKAISQDDVLKVDFVDVQQGDGTVIESPKGHVLLLDGGDNQLFARYLAGRFRGTSLPKPKEIDYVVISHGDADHFAGLTQIYKSETHPVKRKRLFLHPQRVYHNGLVKRPGKKNGKNRPEKEMFGKTTSKGGDTIIVDLEDNLLEVPSDKMNKPFKAWKKALQAYNPRGEQDIEFRRLQKGSQGDFDLFAQENISIEVLGPLITKVGNKEGLKFLGQPAPGPHIGHDSPTFSGHSASHTVNGHSIVLRLQYKNIRFLFAGDLNHESGRDLVQNSANKLQAEVFKAPHHGSADFSKNFLKAVAPIISVVSSGDENLRKEYIHPRATLMGALGKFSRSEIQEPLVFATEMVAFFHVEGFVGPYYHAVTSNGIKAINKRFTKIVDLRKRERFFSFSRSAFGIVKVRTNGKHLVVYTHSGDPRKKEVYAYQAQHLGQLAPMKVKTA